MAIQLEQATRTLKFLLKTRANRDPSFPNRLTERNPRDIPQKNAAYRQANSKTVGKHVKPKKRTTDGRTGQFDKPKPTVLCCVRARVRACVHASKAKQFPGCANPPNLRYIYHINIYIYH